MNEKIDKLAASLIGNRDPAQWLELVRELQRLGISTSAEYYYAFRRDSDRRYWDPKSNSWGHYTSLMPLSSYYMQEKEALVRARILAKEQIDVTVCFFIKTPDRITWQEISLSAFLASRRYSNGF